jgi:hypothetical protein
MADSPAFLLNCAVLSKRSVKEAKANRIEKAFVLGGHLKPGQVQPKVILSVVAGAVIVLALTGARQSHHRWLQMAGVRTSARRRPDEMFGGHLKGWS